MSEENVSVPVKVISSPPPAAQPAKEADDPAAQIRKLREKLMQSRDRHVLMEYLRLRRAMR
jgi:hypothetical protein